jgi:flagellar hook protein FlgE
MFVLQDPSVKTLSTTTTFGGQLYSRAGAFTFDQNNVLTNPDGYQVLGYPITAGVPGTTLSLIKSNVPAPPAGAALEKVSVDDQGIMSALYSDGTTAQIYQVALAKFPSTAGLDKAGGSLFSQTTVSGKPTFDNTGNKVLSNSLEQSNVDMAEQLVKMITTQRAYTANSKTITAADQMTQDTLNIIR